LSPRLSLGVDEDVDVVAGQRKAGHAHHVVDAHRHGALALGHHRRQAALVPAGASLPSVIGSPRWMLVRVMRPSSAFDRSSRPAAPSWPASRPCASVPA
jgi:hypothetical protein